MEFSNMYIMRNADTQFNIIILKLLIPPQVTNQSYANPAAENSSSVHLLQNGRTLKPLRTRGTPRNRFVYVKIEKTGSSTFSNIFSSYGYRHQLNMMMSTIPG